MLQKLLKKNSESDSLFRNEKDYLDYCKSLEQTLTKPESRLHLCDDPEEIAMMAMQTACEFYQADWCGFLEVDLDLRLWTPYLWHNTHPIDKTLSLLKNLNPLHLCPAGFGQ